MALGSSLNNSIALISQFWRDLSSPSQRPANNTEKRQSSRFRIAYYQANGRREPKIEKFPPIGVDACRP